MAKNGNLHNAKSAKNDEFYTQLTDVEKELKYYKDFFKGKKVLCNCNDDRWSAFFQYFSMNFEHLGLSKLTCVAYNENGNGKKYVYNGDLNLNRRVDDFEVVETELQGHGDFADEECVALLKEADVVVTNPPFSLFRKFIALLMEHNKKFLVIGNNNAITYKEFFPYIKNGQVWLGRTLFTGKMPFFKVSDDYDFTNDRYEKRSDGYYKQVNGVCWFTNISNCSNKQELCAYLTYKNNEDDYPKYDNYEAINVDRFEKLPIDYDGVIGVPITALKYMWDDGTIHVEINGKTTQFEIVDLDRYAKGNLYPNKRMFIKDKEMYARILIRKLS